jgi:hypothetical protein
MQRQIVDYSRRFGDLSIFVTEWLVEFAALSNALFWGL